MTEISLELLIQYLGQPNKAHSNQIYWQCPYCAAVGEDSSKNNLTYSKSKKIVKCFANDSHSKSLLKDMSLSNKAAIPSYNYNRGFSEPTKPSIDECKRQNFLSYLHRCNENLLQNNAALDLIFNKRGINKSTVESCKIGLDKGFSRWIFPTFEFNCNNEQLINGFEYRCYDLGKKGLHREKNTPTCMAMVNSYTPDKSCLVILEGYLDAYAFFNHIQEQGQLAYYHIATPSNGVSNIVSLVKSIEHYFNNYKRIYLYLDSDDIGCKKMAELTQRYPFIESKIMACGCKDFNEHYLKCIKSNTNIKSGSK